MLKGKEDNITSPAQTEEYKRSLDFLFSQLPMFSRVGAPAYKPGLEMTMELDRIWNHPHRHFKSIHIGGTNGKGSTSHALASILQAQGYKTALYTSPHLVDFRERMRINGKKIPERMVVEFVRKWCEKKSNLHPSFFELTMMMAFDWFASERVDYAVIEVGMGGRLDSTNIITPIGCVITNISNDHTQFLGNSPEAIAGEKAGILKSGIPAVIGEAEGRVRGVFESRGASVEASLCFADDTLKLMSVRECDEGWMCESVDGKFLFPLGGDYQKKNINTVLHAVDMLRQEGVAISDESVCRGLENIVSSTGLMGRWMKLGSSPMIIADTGHNIAGMTYNVNQLRRLMSLRPTGVLRIVIGFVADKTIDAILKILPEDAVYYITAASIPRAMPACELAQLFRNAGFDSTRVYDNVVEAVKGACRDAKKDDVIFIGGSTFVVADALPFIID